MKGKTLAEKVNLEEFLNSLIKIYEEGADFVDLEFDHTKNLVRIIVKPEYYSEDNEWEEYNGNDEEDPIGENDFEDLI